MEAARRTHATTIAARTRIMSTPAGAYKIWRHPHLKLVDKCLQYVVWLAMRLDKLDSVAKLAGPEGAKARRRMVQFNAGAAAHFAVKHWTATVETTPEGVELIVYSPKVDGPVPVVLWIHGGGFTIGAARDAFGAELCAAAVRERSRTPQPPLCCEVSNSARRPTVCSLERRCLPRSGSPCRRPRCARRRR